MTVAPTALPASAHGLRRVFAWPRLALLLVVAPLWALPLAVASASTPFWIWALRAAVMVAVSLLAYGVLETRPPRLPPRLARWVLQLLGIVVLLPVGSALAFWLTTGDLHFWRQTPLFNGWWVMSLMGMLFGPWIALTGMLRQREAFARHQALAFELQRSELERRALDAQLRLLQAQVEPHFLFNTLANVRALVKTGSPQAERVLGSLIAYLRAAVPRLDQPDSSFEHERQLVQAYLELMQMRMPDRLQFALAFDAQALPLACPPMAVLTLVENAVRHGIDPSESGGRVDVSVSHQASQCHVRVCDSGVGLGGGALQAGTGLWNLRERLQLAFAGQAQLRVMARPEGGTLAEIDLPARAVAAAHATAP